MWALPPPSDDLGMATTTRKTKVRAGRAETTLRTMIPIPIPIPIPASRRRAAAVAALGAVAAGALATSPPVAVLALERIAVNHNESAARS
jgi:hypothetical protein